MLLILWISAAMVVLVACALVFVGPVDMTDSSNTIDREHGHEQQQGAL
ncbi:hypothetical protein [Porticoccus sp. W117]|nr:hypothetical protein [Porticoccus sp. W117]